MISFGNMFAVSAKGSLSQDCYSVTKLFQVFLFFFQLLFS